MYGLLGLAILLGFWVHDVFVVIFVGTLIALLVRTSRQMLIDFWEKVHARVGIKMMWGLIVLFPVLYVATWVLNLLSLKPSYYDFGQYVQMVHNFALHGLPVYTARDNQDINYFLEHRSLSIYVLSFIYRVIPSTMTVAVYQAALAVMPAVLIGLWASRQREVSPMRMILSVLFYFFTLSFLAQALWPYTLHILAPTFLILAYICFAAKRHWLWLLCLILLAFEKEEFGLLSLGFALAGLLAAFRFHEKRWTLPSLLAMAVGLWGVSFSSQYAAGGFAANFGHLGQTPREAISHLLADPLLLVQSLCNGKSLWYLGYFLVLSFVWLKPSWKSFFYLLPVLPLLFVNALSSDASNFRHLDAHYSILINVGIYAMLVMTVLPKLSPGRPRWADGLFLLIGCAHFALAASTVPLNFVTSIGDFRESRTDAAIAKPVIGVGEEKTLCCTNALCGAFSQHQKIYLIEDCLKFPERINGTVLLVLIPKAKSLRFFRCSRSRSIRVTILRYLGSKLKLVRGVLEFLGSSLFSW